MNIFEENLDKWLKKDIGISLEDTDFFDQYSFDVKIGILKMFVQWACESQNIANIELGRKRVSHLNKKWLQDHLIDAAKDALDLSDEWEYRRFVELVIVAVPELKKEAVEIGMQSNNADIREASDDYKNIERF